MNLFSNFNVGGMKPDSFTNKDYSYVSGNEVNLNTNLEGLRLQILEAWRQHDLRVEDIAIITHDFREQISKLQNKLNDLETDNISYVVLMDNFRELNGSLTEENEKLRNDLAYISMLRERMKNTMSWKATAPFRKFARFFK
jgi:hypothetical protein